MSGLSIYCGDDKVWTATVYTDSTQASVLNLTGMQAATFLIKGNVDDPDASALITKTLTSGVATSVASLGLMTITMAASDSSALGSRFCMCALKIEDSQSKTYTVYSDTFTFTRPAVRVAAS